MLDIGRNHLLHAGQEYGPGVSATPVAGSVIAVAATTVAAVASIWLLSWARGLFIPLSFALLLAIGLRPAVNALQRLYVPRVAGAALLLMGIPALAALMVQVLAPTGSWRALVGDLAGLCTSATGPCATLLVLYLLLVSGTQLHQRALGSISLSPQLRSRGLDTIADIGMQLRRYCAVLCATDAVLLWLSWTALRFCLAAARARDAGRALLAGSAGHAATAHSGLHAAATPGLDAMLQHLSRDAGHAGSQWLTAARLLAASGAAPAPLPSNVLLQSLFIVAAALAVSTVASAAFTLRFAGAGARMNATTVCVGLLCWSWLWGLPGLLLAMPAMLTFKILCSRSPQLGWLDGLMSDYPRRQSLAARRALARTVRRAYSG